MTIHPNSSFPLLENSQAEVVRIFLGLMCEWDRAGRPSEVTTNEPIGPLNNSNDSWSPGELPDRQ